MNKTIFVISDLHLGGNFDFQMCSRRGQQKLAEFIRWAANKKTVQHDVNLVLAGDIVDFLAEEPFEAFTASDKDAEIKLNQIIEHTSWETEHNKQDSVWEAFKDYVSSGAQLTLMLGNHDIELSLPSPRRLLLKTLSPGRVEFTYDNEAFVDGKVLIEHGNRYDRWNAVPHDELRQVRSAISRGETPPEFPQIPGSALVIQIMNNLKKKHSFIDLLKPEGEASIPFLVVLDPSSLLAIQKFYKLPLYKSFKRLLDSYDKEGKPRDRGLIAADSNSNSDKKFIENLKELAGTPTSGQIGFVEHLKAFPYLWQSAHAGNNNEQTKQIDRLYKALRMYIDIQRNAYNPTYEEENYLAPAKAMARRGFEAIVFGHTHLVKRVNLADVNPKSTYLNSGTWADIIFLPDSVIKGDEVQAKLDLQKLADDLTTNELDDWRKLVPSFVQIDLDNEKVVSSDAFIFNSPDDIKSILPLYKNLYV